ncbi:DUF1194 domain-containing protein [Elstera cyanobacteriorum]|uniref:DUF1194 domain-containing protein n=1 Tax=Elstera cyanobacteriorum TaxID=2022747 RepID=UPI00235240AE|nr:DUF1194 domain-containing protein [Elstera cyanobacteriorum]MCK6443934.1 DUF1194 domain-containing protein [Elstera cyanobacteriorum]
MRRFLAVLLMAGILPGVAYARVVDLLLVMAVDVSRSIDEEEFTLQREGYAQALTDPAVVTAIRSGPMGAIAVAYMEWSGAGLQAVLVPWTVIDTMEAAQRVAAILRREPRPFGERTGVGAAIGASVALIEAAPHEGLRQVIDISGDGRNSSGPEPRAFRDIAVEKGIIINALPIVNDKPTFGRMEVDLPGFFRDEVIGGPGAFLQVAEGFGSFAAAIKAKLVREIAWQGQADESQRIAVIPLGK